MVEKLNHRTRATSLHVRRILNRAARRGRLGSLTPFVHPVLHGVTRMPKAALAARILPQTKPEPVLIVSQKVDTLLDERLEVAAKIDQLTAKKKALDAAILTECVKRSGRKDGIIETDEYTVTAVNATNSHIDKKALLDAGVRVTIIEKATKVTPYTYPRITKKKPELTAEDVLKSAVRRARS